MSINRIKTAAKNATIITKAKRNDIVVISLRHTSTTAKFKTLFHYTFFLAKATSVSREGRVLKYTRPHWGSSEAVDLRHCVYVIAEDDKQGAAKEIYATELGARDFDDADQIKAAILDRVEALS